MGLFEALLGLWTLGDCGARVRWTQEVTGARMESSRPTASAATQRSNRSRLPLESTSVNNIDRDQRLRQRAIQDLLSRIMQV